MERLARETKESSIDECTWGNVWQQNHDTTIYCLHYELPLLRFARALVCLSLSILPASFPS
jgi:hypothetical protein